MKHKVLRIMIVASLIYVNGLAQPLITGQATVGGKSGDFLKSIVAGSDGSVVAAGYSSSNRSCYKSEKSRGVTDYWVVKLKAGLKAEEWDKTIGSSDSDNLSVIQPTSDGGYILGGSSKSNAGNEKSQNSKGGYDYWVVKLSATGNVQWDKTIGGSADDMCSSLQQTCDGGYILAGTSKSPKSGDKTENGQGGNDYWVVKLSASGNKQWDRTFGGTGEDNCSAVKQTKNGGYVLAGSSSSNKGPQKSEDSRGGLDYWVVKLSATGKEVADKTVGGGADDECTVIQETKDCGYILAGSSHSKKSGDKTGTKRGAADYWVVKLNAKANLQWDQTIGGRKDDFATDILQTTDGDYVVAGSSESDKSCDKSENSRGGFDYWVVKLNGNGKLLGDKTLGGTEGDDLSSIEEEAKDKYVAGGISLSGKGGDKTQGSDGVQDYWVVKMSWVVKLDGSQQAVTTVDAESEVKSIENSKDLLVYPNPAKDVLKVQVKGRADLTLTDQSGKIVLIKSLVDGGEINISHLPAGAYYLRNNATGAVQKVIVSK